MSGGREYEDYDESYSYGDAGFQNFDAAYDTGYQAEQDRRGYEEERRTDRDRERYGRKEDEKWYSGMESLTFGSSSSRRKKQDPHDAGAAADGVEVRDWAYANAEGSGKGKQAEQSDPKVCTCSSRRKAEGRCNCGASESKHSGNSKKDSSSKKGSSSRK